MDLSFVKTELEQKGYCIVPNVLSKEDIESYKMKFHKWRKSIPGLDKFHNTLNPHHIYKYHEVGHQEFAWDIRVNKKVQDVFRYLWDTDDLVVSFDGCCWMDKNVKKRDNIWTHSDQSPKKKGLHCYQGFVSMTDNKEKTLVVYEGSHKLLEDYYKNMEIKETGDWNLIDKDYLDLISPLKKKLKVPAGALVLWESRTFHQNNYGKQNDEERLVQYVCYLPKNNKKNSKAMQKKRRKYFDTRRTTSHWPYNIKVNAKQPRNYGNNDYVINYDDLPKPNLEKLMPEIEKII